MALGTCAVAVAVWLWFGSGEERTQLERATGADGESAVVEEATDEKERTRRVLFPLAPGSTSPVLGPAPATSVAPPEGRIVGPGPDDPHEPGMHPHPITPEHRRIFRENQLIQSLNDAMTNRDVPAMRTLIDEYHEAEPEDVHRQKEGYEIVADCFEHPGEASRAEAERYWHEARGSILRRFVRRYCLEAR